MSDEMMVQNSRPSAVPYLLGGAVVGAGLGAASPWGFTKPKYASFDDVLKEYKDNDKFTKSKEAAKGDDAKKAYETIETEMKTYTEAQAGLDKQIADLTEKHSSWAEKLTKDEDAKKLIEGYETANKTLEEAEKGLLEDVKAKIQGAKFEGVAKDLSDDDLTKTAEELIANSPDKVKEQCKDASTALDNAKEAVTQAKTGLENKAEELGVGKDKMKELSKEGKDEIEKLTKSGTEAKTKAEKAIKESMEKLKGPKRWLNALVLASALALGALAFRPKADNNI